jgi:hypothetical protein
MFFDQPGGMLDVAMLSLLVAVTAHVCINSTWMEALLVAGFAAFCCPQPVQRVVIVPVLICLALPRFAELE